MMKTLNIDSNDYLLFFDEIKEFIKVKQLEALRKVNKELIELYWDLGKKIVSRQKKLNWGNAVIKKLSQDLQKDFSGIQGFSERNLHNMRNFYLSYYTKPDIHVLLYEIGWSHHVVIINGVKDAIAREYYIRATKKYGWTKNILIHKIESSDFERFAVFNSDNFEQTLPEHIQEQAKLALKDHFIFDFLEMGQEHSEREFEHALISHLHKFIVELGLGEFAFMGNQFKIEVGSKDYYIDLLFHHRSLCCLIACDLKIGEFKPEYAGKMNFYLTALDRQIRKPHENRSIGIILCKEKNDAVVEYAFTNQNSPMGAATYTLEKELPNKYKGLLPSPEALKQQFQKWDLNSSQFVQLTPEIEQNKKSSLNNRQVKWLKKTQVGDKITTKEYAKKMKISEASALRDLNNLKKEGYVTKKGKRKGSHFQKKQEYQDSKPN